MTPYDALTKAIKIAERIAKECHVGDGGPEHWEDGAKRVTRAILALRDSLGEQNAAGQATGEVTTRTRPSDASVAVDGPGRELSALPVTGVRSDLDAGYPVSAAMNATREDSAHAAPVPAAPLSEPAASGAAKVPRNMELVCATCRFPVPEDGERFLRFRSSVPTSQPLARGATRRAGEPDSKVWRHASTT